MIRKIVVMILAFVFLFAELSPLMAQTAREKRQTMMQERRAYRKQLTPEEKEKIKHSAEVAVDRLKNLTDEQKAKIKTGVERGIDKLKNLTPEQKEKLKAEIKKVAEAIHGLSAEQKAAVKDAIISVLP